MKRFLYTIFALLLLAACAEGNNELSSHDPLEVPDKAGYNVKGMVLDEYAQPIEGVVVSDGLHTTKTDSNGFFWLDSDLALRRFVSVTIPSGYEIQSENGLPQFFERIPEGADSFCAEFRLKSRREPCDRYTLFMVGDPQIRDRNRGYDKFAYHSIDMFEDMCRDMNKVYATMTDRPVYGIGLGDLTHEDVNMWEVYCGGVASLRFPMFGVIGNHDHNTKAATDNEAIRPYEENIGPTNYSFDLGKLHFICLDNIIMRGDGAGGYDDGLSDEVYTWLCNDLKYVPKEKIIMIWLAQLAVRQAGQRPCRCGPQRQTLCRQTVGVQIRAFVGGALPSQFQQGLRQDFGKQTAQCRGTYRSPCDRALWLNEWVCSDGTPRGYYIVDVDGEEIEWYYHPCGNQLGVSNGFDDYYQIRAYRPGDYEDGYVYANVWGWDALWGNVLYTDNGEGSVEKRPMARYVTYDKAYKDCCDLSNSKPGNIAKEEFEPDMGVQHIFRIVPSEGATSCTIEVTDRFGRSYSTSLDWGR